MWNPLICESLANFVLTLIILIYLFALLTCLYCCIIGLKAYTKDPHTISIMNQVETKMDPKSDLCDQLEKSAKVSNEDSTTPVRKSSSFHSSNFFVQINRFFQSSETSEAGGNDFQLDKLKLYFESCISTEGQVLIDQYILGYDELYKFLNLLGTVFSWVASDVQAKLEVNKYHKLGFNVWLTFFECNFLFFILKIIRNFRKDPELGIHFETIETMTSYEVKENLIKTKAKDCSTGILSDLKKQRLISHKNYSHLF